MNLTRYDNEGVELLVNQDTGECYASIRGIARMTDKDDKSIRNYVNGEIEGADKMQLLNAEIPTPRGLQGAALLNEDQILELIIKYKPDLLVKFAKAGLRLYLYGLAGFSYQPQLAKAPQSNHKLLTSSEDKAAQVSAIMMDLYRTDSKMFWQVINESMPKIKYLPEVLTKGHTTTAMGRAVHLGYSPACAQNAWGLSDKIGTMMKPVFSEKLSKRKHGVNHFIVCDRLDDIILDWFGFTPQQ